MHPWYHPSLSGAYGCAHRRQARTIMSAASSVNTAAANHAEGRHRGERSRPVGNSRRMNPNPAIGIAQAQFWNHAAARATGSDPGAATVPRCPYRQQKKARPSVRPAPRKIQPVLFPGRLEASTKPTAGTAMNVTSSKTEEKSQPLSGTRCRPAYDSTIPPAISATDTAAAHPATHGAVRALIRNPCRRPKPQA
jgi:hypothetical protein